MISFKEFSKKLPVLSWPGHETLRDSLKKVLPVLSWPGHETLRDNIDASVKRRQEASIDESSIEEGWGDPISYLDHGDEQTYDKEFHDHPDVKPKGLTDAHKKAIWDYTSTPSANKDDGHGSSRNINGHLRNLLGDKTAKVMHHTAQKVHSAVKNLSAAFTPENTNRKKIITYGGVPKHIGDALKKSGHGSEHHLAGFTSTSSSQQVANNFAKLYGKPTDKVHHVIEYHVEPGSGLSAVSHTRYPENEVILHHGAKISYHGTKTYKNERTKTTTHVHVVHVHGPEHHKPLTDYGFYDNPKG